MTPTEFRRIALSMPEATEGEHMRHPDFRVKGKIFATLFTRADVEWGMVKLKPDDQRQFIKDHPKIFEPASGAWGRWGCTLARLASLTKPVARDAISAAWLNCAPKGLVESKPRARTKRRK